MTLVSFRLVVMIVVIGVGIVVSVLVTVVTMVKHPVNVTPDMTLDALVMSNDPRFMGKAMTAVSITMTIPPVIMTPVTVSTMTVSVIVVTMPVSMPVSYREKKPQINGNTNMAAASLGWYSNDQCTNQCGQCYDKFSVHCDLRDSRFSEPRT